jgi:hypothetical protein
MKDDPKPQALLVCRRIDYEFTIRGSAFDKQCHRCGTRVMIAPSGLRRLEREPIPDITCWECVNQMMSREDVAKCAELAAPSQEIRRELANDVIENPWRKRN